MRYSLLFVILIIYSAETGAQVLNEMFTEDYSLDSITTRALRIDLNTIGFFRDNEYDSEIQNGYSLPGLRLEPHMAYKPIEQIDLEVGASMLFFNGANRYPCYAYHDIGTWKGDQYQHGCHVLPWLRLQASLKHIDLVVGNIYGGANHNLITPLYNHEQNLSADPEMGVQLLLHRPHIQLDTWLNWQSYIFENDTHQEAFTVGTSTLILWGKRNDSHNTIYTPNTNKQLSFYTPVQLIIQHRGGEQDLTNLGVQTICNASVGFGVHMNCPTNCLNFFDAHLNAIGCYQQSGHIWPFDTGFAYHAGMTSKIFNHINIGLDYLHAPTQFISVYGNPFYSTISLRKKGTQTTDNGTLDYHYDHHYDGLHTLRIGIGYSYTFSKAYTLGADAELFNNSSKQRTSPNERGQLRETNFSFGIYLRISPSLILKKF